MTTLTCYTGLFIRRISSVSTEQSQSGVESSLEQILERPLRADLKVLAEHPEKFRSSRKNSSLWLIFRDYRQLREAECFQNLENFESMPLMSEIESLRTTAKFYHPVEEENYKITTPLEDDGWGRRTSRCKEYTGPRNQEDSRPYASIDANQEIGPGLNIGIATILDVLGIEVQVPSLSTPERSIWILISRGYERFVNEIHRHNPEPVNYSSSLRTKEENFDNVSFESVKPATGNREHGPEGSEIAKSDDKPSSDLRKAEVS